MKMIKHYWVLSNFFITDEIYYFKLLDMGLLKLLGIKAGFSKSKFNMCIKSSLLVFWNIV